jgi:hypothetical protein
MKNKLVRVPKLSEIKAICKLLTCEYVAMIENITSLISTKIEA